ncbi:MAG TPA: OmpA family protein [Chlorobiota bacterium]|nr:OmpA family protein [Chlorobiota bacterium]
MTLRYLTRSLPLVCVLTTILSVTPTTAFTQTTKSDGPEWRAGLFGAGTLNIHNGEFSSYEGLQGCGTFSDAITPGWTLGNVVEARLRSGWGAMARIGFWQADGSFQDPATLSPLVALPDGSTVRMSTEYELETTLDVVTMDLLVTYGITDRLRVGLGPQVGFTTRASFEQHETILEPSIVRFANGATSRLILAAPFDQQGAVATERMLRIGATLNLSYDIPIAKRLELSPEIGATYAFTNVLSSFDWTAHMVRAGLRLSYVFGSDDVPPPPPSPEPQPAPPVVMAPPPPYVDVDVRGRDEDGAMESVSEIVLTDARTVDVVPLLPNIFFDSVSATLPQRYTSRQGQTADFIPEELSGDVIDVYHDILNIVGYRMKQRPSSTLSIVGHREPADGETDVTLSRRRAEVVRDYLVSVWNIDPSRLTIGERELPARPSNRTLADGRAENRRVELSPSDASVLAPVRRSLLDGRIVPDPLVVAPQLENVTNADVRITSTDGTVFAEENIASGAALTWKPTTTLVRSLLASGQRRIVVTAAAGEESTRREARRTITLRRSVLADGERDTIRERHRLVFFGFDDDRISAIDTPLVEAIHGRLRTTSKVVVTGYTDRIGDVGHNTSLSTRRAGSVATSLLSRIKPTRLDQRGAGPEEIHDNNLPEGRMYNRTVVIDVATPRDVEAGDE